MYIIIKVSLREHFKISVTFIYISDDHHQQTKMMIIAFNYLHV